MGAADSLITEIEAAAGPGWAVDGGFWPAGGFWFVSAAEARVLPGRPEGLAPTRLKYWRLAIF